MRNERLGAFLEGAPRCSFGTAGCWTASSPVRAASALEAAIREHGRESAASVRQAILECDGSISFIPIGGT